MHEQVLLITAASPNEILKGTVVEQRKIAAWGREPWLHWVLVRPWAKEETSPLSQVRLSILRPWFRPYRFFVTKPGHWVLRALWSRRAARRLADLCRRERICRIWTVPETWAISVALQTSRLTGLPIHVTVHDLPLRDRQLDEDRPEWYWRVVERECIRLYKAADSIDVVSRALQAHVRQYAKCPVRLYLPRVNEWRGGGKVELERGAEGRQGVFCLGFNGNMHTDSAEVEVFLHWLKRISANYEFHVFGPRAVPPVLVPKLRECGAVVEHPYEPDFERYVEGLSRMDACYVGAWFSADKDLTVRYSFPSKIAAPLSASVPLICHGPPYWELAAWLKEIPFGIYLDNIQEAIVPGALEQFVADNVQRGRYRQGADEMFKRWLRLPEDGARSALPWEEN